MNLSFFVIVLAWINAFAIAGFTLLAYQEAICQNLKDAKSHLRLAGLIAIMTALLTTSTIASQHNRCKEMKCQSSNNASWNASPSSIASTLQR
jgi:hypothetical protein